MRFFCLSSLARLSGTHVENPGHRQVCPFLRGIGRRWNWVVQTYLPIAALHLADELGSDEPDRIPNPSVLLDTADTKYPRRPLSLSLELVIDLGASPSNWIRE